jgi:ketosteroid isomerase-like protein
MLSDRWDDVRESEQARRKAMVEADPETLSRLFAPDMVWIHGTGTVVGTTELLDAIASGSTKYLAIDCSEEKWREINGLVFITGLLNLKLQVGSQSGEVQNRFTIVWRNIQDRWQVVHWQSTGIREP